MVVQVVGGPRNGMLSGSPPLPSLHICPQTPSRPTVPHLSCVFSVPSIFGHPLGLAHHGPDTTSWSRTTSGSLLANMLSSQVLV